MSNFGSTPQTGNNYYFNHYKLLLEDNKRLSNELYHFKNHNNDLLEFLKSKNTMLEELKIMYDSFCEHIVSISFPSTFLFCQKILWKDRKINEISYKGITYKNIVNVLMRYQCYNRNKQELLVISYLGEKEEHQKLKEFFIINDLSLVTIKFNNS